jgi:hypothetical protein
MVHFTLWNYNPHNDNFYGDHWNGEDFSIFSNPVQTAFGSQQLGTLHGKIFAEHQELKSPDSPFDLIENFFNDHFKDQHAAHGGRALDAVVRPYAAKTAGAPISTMFILETLSYELVFLSPKYVSKDDVSEMRKTHPTANITEIFIPLFHYGEAIEPKVVISDGSFEFDTKRQTIYWKIDPLESTSIPYTKNTTHPKWISASRFLVTESREEAYNFHTIQITPGAKITRRPMKSKKCNIL